MSVHDDFPTGKGGRIVASPGEGGGFDGGGEGFSGDTMFREDAVRMGRSGGMFEIIAFVECGPVGSYISPCPGWSAGIQGGDGQGGFRGVLQGV